MAAAVTALAKLAIPLGVGLLFIAGRKGKSAETDALKIAVAALQEASAGNLELAIERLRDPEAGDPTTADLLDFQKARMIARGSPGFTDAPLFTDDPGLKIDNQEVVPRLIQLEGRTKALRAWAKAYAGIGAKMAAKDLNAKADQLDALSKKDKAKSSGSGKTSGGGSSGDKSKAKSKAKAKASDKGTAPTPDLTDVIKQVTDALASGSVAIMRKTAADLRAHGYTEQADSLDAAADELEAQQNANKGGNTPAPGPSPSPGPSPAPAPASHRVYTVVKNDSESAIAKKLAGSSSHMSDLVALNIPKDADGRARQKVTASLIAQKASTSNPINPNRLGGLYPGLQPGQNLFIPDDWKTKPEDTKPTPKPAPKPSSGGQPGTGDSLTTQLITMLVGKSPGKEDTFLVKKWQSAQGRTADGKYGPGDATYMADNLGVVPPSPLYWPKSNTQKALTAWHQEMARLAVQNPSQAEAYAFADKAGKQPGFEGVPTSAKIVSRRYGDGLGSL